MKNRLKKGIVFTIVLSFILSPFFGFDVYHTVQAATIKVQKENMWCDGFYKKTVSSDKKIWIEEWGTQGVQIIYYKGKLYFKDANGSRRLLHTKSKKATVEYTNKNYVITSSNPKVVKISDNPQNHLSCPKIGTSILTVKDKKGNVVNKTKITVTNPTYRLDFKAMCKDFQNNKYTGGDIFYIGTYLKCNGKRLSEKQQERAIKYGDHLMTDGNWIMCGRNGIGGGAAFELHRYLGKQTGLMNNKKDLSEQRRLNCRISAKYKAEKTEMATKPEDGSWNVFYKGETARVPFSIKNQTAKKLYYAVDKGYGLTFKQFITTFSGYETYIPDYKHNPTLDCYKYKYFKSSEPYIDHVTAEDTIYGNTLADFYVMVLPISKAGEIYYPEKDEIVGRRSWTFPHVYTLTSEGADIQTNITVDGMIYSSINPDNTLNDFAYKYGDKFSDHYNKPISDFTDVRNGWTVTVIEDGITYSNQDNTLYLLDEKYSYFDESGRYHSWQRVSDFYNMAVEKGWAVTIQKDDEYYSTENTIDNSLVDFGRRYQLSTNCSTVSELNKSHVPDDFSFNYEVLYNGTQLYSIDCHA